ncbi:MAG: 2,3-diphosphoglycerate-dependent phosphoglycerate mutase [Hyphomonadaceae bacterium]|jgi:2,3-bisphosphoglycerate-dependent phosphoglycerate mutase|nr:2,3-diphosphoglycerate-dependent phosphoglycerate mutase [Hyphomonadaceae bacterium]
MPSLVLIRHGQSQWNLENRFTGWHDVPLTERGEAEASAAGALIAATGLTFASTFTSMQTRAIRTLWLALTAMDACWLPEEKSWRLNERHYGALTGLNKAETAERHGAAQVHIWRRSYDIPPPALEASDPRHPAHDARYATVPQDLLPATESLKTTLERVLPYWQDTIAPALGQGNVIIAAHGNSLRALVKHLFAVPDATITEVEIPTGNPLLIDLDEALRPVGVRYLDPERATPLPALP